MTPQVYNQQNPGCGNSERQWPGFVKKLCLEKKKRGEAITQRRHKHTKPSAMCGPHLEPNLKNQEKYVYETKKEIYQLTGYLTILGILISIWNKNWNHVFQHDDGLFQESIA